MDKQFLQNIAIVVQALKQAGYVPYDQLLGYVNTNNLAYITRRDNARELVRQMDPSLIQQYLGQKKN